MFRFLTNTNIKFVDNFRYGPSLLKQIYFYQDPLNTNTSLFFNYTVFGDQYENDAFYFNNVLVEEVDYYYATLAPFVVSSKSS